MKLFENQFEFRFLSTKGIKVLNYTLLIFLLFSIAGLVFMSLPLFLDINMSLDAIASSMMFASLGGLMMTRAGCIIYENHMRKKNNVNDFVGMAPYHVSKTSHYKLEQLFNIFWFSLGFICFIISIF